MDHTEQEFKDLVNQVNELRSLLTKCYKMIPDDVWIGDDLVEVKRGLTRYDCWPDGKNTTAINSVIPVESSNSKIG